VAASEVGITLADDQAAALRSAAEFRAHRFRIQEEQRARLRAELPLPQLEAPFLFTDGIGPDELDRLASMLADAVRRLPDDEPRVAHHAPAEDDEPDDEAGDNGGGEVIS
jgi:hypothetical protein